jgi:hypothetical protein
MHFFSRLTGERTPRTIEGGGPAEVSCIGVRDTTPVQQTDGIIGAELKSGGKSDAEPACYSNVKRIDERGGSNKLRGFRQGMWIERDQIQNTATRLVNLSTRRAKDKAPLYLIFIPIYYPSWTSEDEQPSCRMVQQATHNLREYLYLHRP